MSQKSRHRRVKSAAAQNQPVIDLLMHPDAAGIDVGAEEFVAAVPPGRGGQEDVRTFKSFTSGVEALRDWLLACGIRTVAMESTGNYWITLYDMLTEAGMDVYLVNARHVKGVPGRKKTDVCDAVWLQQLHAAGLLAKSYRPAREIVGLRFLMRHRSGLVGDAARQLQLMQKALTEMNLKLHHVFSDIDGMSAQAIIDAILQGERDARRLAQLRDRRCKSKLDDILEALRGDYREEYLFVLAQSQSLWRALLAQIAECDLKITEEMAKVSRTVEAPLPPAPERQRRMTKNSPKGPIFEEAWRFYNVDLSPVPAVGAGLLAVLMSEVGTREQLLEAFHSPAALSSWLGVCPDNRISGGKVLKAKTRKVSSRLAAALRLGVFGLNKAQNPMGDYYRRMKARLGKAEGTVAAAHKLIRILYGMIKSGRPYDEKEAFKITPQTAARRRRNLEKQAAALGLQLVAAA
jgi:transposase